MTILQFCCFDVQLQQSSTGDSNSLGKGGGGGGMKEIGRKWRDRKNEISS